MNRDDLTEELREAQADFHQLLDRAGPKDLRRRTNGTRWTNRQLLFHMMFGYIIVRTPSCRWCISSADSGGAAGSH